MNKREAEKYMNMALELALKGEGRTHPNPMVGAVIVSAGKVIGQGYHLKAGLPHAEPLAIKNAKQDLKGAVMFVTLEPCDHYGKTPPCTEAIMNCGIRKVYVAMKDPNPINSGRGISRLKRSGIEVELGVLGAEARSVNRAYIKFITRGLPYVTVKSAQSLDGKIAAKDGTSRWISSPQSRKYVKKLRAKVDAVMVGINTVLKDNPLLLPEKRPGKRTLRIVLDSTLRIDKNSRLVKTAGISPLLLVTTKAASAKKIQILSRKTGVEVIVAKSDEGRVDLGDFFQRMAKRGVVSILSEAGGELTGALLDGGFVDEVIFFVAPKLLGGSKVSVAGKGAVNINDAIQLRSPEVSMSGGDILIRSKLN